MGPVIIVNGPAVVGFPKVVVVAPTKVGHEEGGISYLSLLS